MKEEDKKRVEEIDLQIELLELRLKRIEQLEKSIFELKVMKAQIPLYFQPILPHNLNYHFHGQNICYQNPCYRY